MKQTSEQMRLSMLSIDWSKERMRSKLCSFLASNTVLKTHWIQTRYIFHLCAKSYLCLRWTTIFIHVFFIVFQWTTKETNCCSSCFLSILWFWFNNLENEEDKGWSWYPKLCQLFSMKKQLDSKHMNLVQHFCIFLFLRIWNYRNFFNAYSQCGILYTTFSEGETAGFFGLGICMELWFCGFPLNFEYLFHFPFVCSFIMINYLDY